VNEEYTLCFAVAQPRYNLFCTFQCEFCHFWNLQGKSPHVGSGFLVDVELLKCLRRINLDAFWSREPSTVSQHLWEIDPALQIALEMGMSNPPLPKLGPLKLEDEFGAGATIIMAKHSIDPGMTESIFQFETVRKMRSAFNQAFVDNASTEVIGGKDGKKQLVMGVPICHGWYDREKTGMHHRMKDKVVQDYGLSTNAVIALQEILEEEWLAARLEAGKRLEIAQLACFVFLGYARTLRGEEINKKELSGVREYSADGAVETRHVTLSLIGRFTQMEGGGAALPPHSDRDWCWA
jgi:hypothetical protein